MPWTDARNLQQATRIVENAGRENGGVLVDAFHFDRSGSRLEDLAKVAPSRLRYAQLCDVAGPRPADMVEILRQARNERRFPGDGDCDLPGLLRGLPADIPLSLEIPTVQLLEQGVSGLDRAQMALDKTRKLLAQF
jgi:sugar phosphate isomerase/epimerase